MTPNSYPPSSIPLPPGQRVGFGYDRHKLEPGRPLWLGGVLIPYDKGLLGHSDGDVFLHALCDALLGSLALGDIGTHFPDTDEQYRGIRSTELLRRVADLLRSRDVRVLNVDGTILAQEPRLASYVPAMVEVISDILEIDEERISIKAKTMERQGPIGKGKAMSAFCMALVDTQQA